MFNEQSLSSFNENYTCKLKQRNKILTQVARYFDISPNDLHQTKRGKKNIGRLLSVYLLARLSHMQHSEIAVLIGGIRAKSISALLKRIEKIIDSDVIFKKYVDGVIERLQDDK